MAPAGLLGGPLNRKLEPLSVNVRIRIEVVLVAAAK